MSKFHGILSLSLKHHHENVIENSFKYVVFYNFRAETVSIIAYFYKRVVHHLDDEQVLTRIDFFILCMRIKHTFCREAAEEKSL